MTLRLSCTGLLARMANALLVLMLANTSWAQSLPNTTNFPMIGLVRGQTLQLNLVAIPIDPCGPSSSSCTAF